MSSPRKNKHAIAANTFKPTLLAHAIHITLVGTLFALPALGLLHSNSAYAQSAGVKSYSIPAGPLGVALTTFAAQADMTLSFNADQTRGLHTSGLNGKYSAAAGLQQLLANSGLEAIHRGGSNYVLQAVPASKDTTLPTISITRPTATTEGSGSYTTGTTNTATKLRISSRETPQSTSVITSQRIEDQNLNSLDDILGNTTGITVSGAESDRADFYARGFYIQNVQYDGVPTSLALSMFGESAGDSVIYDRVEVVRGATGLLTGAGNPSAAINMIRKRADSKVFTGSLSASAGSWSNYRTTADLSMPLTEDGRIRARVVGMLQDKASFMDRYHASKQVFYGVVEADLTDRTTLSVGMDYQHNTPTNSTWGGVPRLFSNGALANWSPSKSHSADWTRWDTDNTTAFIKLEHSFANDWQMNTSFTHRDNSYDAKLLYLYGEMDPATGLGLDDFPAYRVGAFKQDSADIYLSGPFSLLGKTHDAVIGATASKSKQSTWGYSTISSPPVGNFYTWNGASYPEPVWGTTKNLLEENTTTQNALYGALRLTLADPLKLIVGARYTQWQTDSLTTTRKHNVVTPYAGLVYDIDKNNSLFASYTDIFQPQNFRDSSGNYLNPELGKNYEVGFKGDYFNNTLQTSLSFFRINQEQVAEAAPGQVDPVSGGQAYRSVDGVRVQGVDGEISGQLHARWSATIGGSYFRKKYQSGKQEPNSQVRLFSTYQFSGNWSPLTIGGGANWQSGATEQDWLGSDPYEIYNKAYTVVNLMARYKFNQQLSAQLNINNLFDKTYYSGGSLSYAGAPRQVTLNLKYNF